MFLMPVRITVTVINKCHLTDTEKGLWNIPAVVVVNGSGFDTTHLFSPKGLCYERYAIDESAIKTSPYDAHGPRFESLLFCTKMREGYVFETFHIIVGCRFHANKIELL